jgi:hypothetical protein
MRRVAGSVLKGGGNGRQILEFVKRKTLACELIPMLVSW